MLSFFNYFCGKIDNKIEIQKNSPEEIEIRANTIWAVQFIKEEVIENIDENGNKFGPGHTNEGKNMHNVQRISFRSDKSEDCIQHKYRVQQSALSNDSSRRIRSYKDLAWR